MIKNIQACIVGLGRAGSFHYTSIKNLPGVTLRYVVDPGLSDQQKSLLENENVRFTHDLDEAISDPDLDAVIISSPTPMHFEQITKALRSSKHVFAEKPMGETVKQIRECFQLAKINKKCLYLGFQRRYDHNFGALKQSLPRIGSLRILKASSRDNPRPAIDYLRSSGNIFHDMLIHDFDMLIHLLGTDLPETVYAMGHCYDEEIRGLDDYDTVMVTLKYPDGLMCSIDTSRISAYGYDQRIELFGSEGMTFADNQKENTLQVYTKSGTWQSPLGHSFPQRYREAYLSEMAHFIEGINRGHFHNLKERDCLLSHLMAEAAHEALTSGHPVNFKDRYELELKTD